MMHYIIKDLFSFNKSTSNAFGAKYTKSAVYHYKFLESEKKYAATKVRTNKEVSVSNLSSRIFKGQNIVFFFFSQQEQNVEN